MQAWVGDTFKSELQSQMKRNCLMQEWGGDMPNSELQSQIKRKLSDAGVGWRYIRVRNTITDKEETVRCWVGLKIRSSQNYNHR